MKQKINFVGGERNPFGEKKNILRPGKAIVNAYTLIAAFYCALSAILFYYVVENPFLAVIHLLALISLIANHLVLIQTKKLF